MKHCNVMGCPNVAVRMYQIAPGTNVWLCQKCIDVADGDAV